MVIYETHENLVRAYSDADVYIRGGYPEGLYAEAWDPADDGRTYEETDIPIQNEEETTDPGEATTDPDEATASDYEQALRDLGVIE